MALAIVVLPAPDLPTTAWISPGFIARDTVDGDEGLVVLAGSRRCADLRCRARFGHRRPRSFGFPKKSRSQSPTTFTASTRPDQRAGRETARSTRCPVLEFVADADERAERRIGRRHADAEEDSVAWVSTAAARLIVAITSTGPITPGRMCRNMMRRPGRPITFTRLHIVLRPPPTAAARTVRAYCTHSWIAMAPMRMKGARRGPDASWRRARATPATSSASRIVGKLRDHVADAHDEGIDAPSEEAGDEAERDADKGGDEHRASR